MTKKTDISDFLANEFKSAKRSVLSGITSINDLKEMDENGRKLSNHQQDAILNYDRYRLYMLKTSKDDEEYRSRYELLQVMANLRQYDEFLNKKYNIGL
ncbi:MAG: hypothetical protein HYY40_12365 [Bacteroidetes bacterium]|nr:hypothetical protein [Bacteroidota bacterium]